MRATRRLLPLAVTMLFLVATLAPASAVAVPDQGAPRASTATSEEPATSARARQVRSNDRFPTSRTSGVPAGWVPQRTVNGDVTVRTPGAVVDGLRIVDGDLIVAAPDVTVRRVEILGGSIDNYSGGGCQTGLVVKATTIRKLPGQATSGDEPAIGVGGYTARRVKIVGLPEGFRVGGKDDCGGVRIINSFARIASPNECGDWHGDGVQGYDGGALLLRNSVLKLKEKDGCGGTAPFFYPSDQGNVSVTIDGLIVDGGGYAFRLGMPGTVNDLHIVKGSYYYGPINVRCSVLSGWQASISVLRNGGQPVPLRKQACNSNGGN